VSLPVDSSILGAFRVQDLPSIRSRISWLVLAWVMPTALVFILLVAHSYTRERDHVVSETAQAARAVAAAVERDLNGAHHRLPIETAETAKAHEG